jgi:hypothetical protein
MNARPQVLILLSDNHRFHAKLSFGQPQLQELFDGGEEWTKVIIPGLAEGAGVRASQPCRCSGGLLQYHKVPIRTSSSAVRRWGRNCM